MIVMTYESNVDRAVRYLTVMNPSWERVVEAIHQLDGVERTVVSVDQVNLANDADSPETMPLGKRLSPGISVGGGEDGIFVVLADVPKDGRLSTLRLIDPAKPDDVDLELVVAGQGVDYPLSFTTDLDTVVAAVRYFFEHGGLNPDCHWGVRPPGSDDRLRELQKDLPW